MVRLNKSMEDYRPARPSKRPAGAGNAYASDGSMGVAEKEE